MDERSPSQPYTVHEDVETIDRPDAPDERTVPARPGPDPLALVGGLAAVVIALLAMTGTLAAVDPRWVLAIGAVAVGGAVLLVTLRRGTRR